MMILITSCDGGALPSRHSSGVAYSPLANACGELSVISRMAAMSTAKKDLAILPDRLFKGAPLVYKLDKYFILCVIDSILATFDPNVHLDAVFVCSCESPGRGTDCRRVGGQALRPAFGSQAAEGIIARLGLPVRAPAKSARVALTCGEGGCGRKLESCGRGCWGWPTR